MEMGSQDAIRSIEPTGEIYICPSCNYEDGFHVSFSVKGNSQDGEIVLICPNCHGRFKIGWKIALQKA